MNSRIDNLKLTSEKNKKKKKMKKGSKNIRHINEHIHKGSSRMRRETEGVESMLKELIAGNFPSFGPRDGHPVYRKLKGPQTRSVFPKEITMKYVIIKMLKMRDKEFLRHVEKNSSSLQGNIYEPNCRLLCRNLERKETMG